MRRTAGAACMAASILLAALFVWFSMWQVNTAGAMCEQLSRDGVVDWKKFAAADPALPADANGLARFLDQGYGARVFTAGLLLAAAAVVSSVVAVFGPDGRRGARVSAE